jgi:biotin transporter BioY
MLDVGFILTYIVVPVVIGWGLWDGRKQKNHRALATANGFKGAFYWYCAIVNFLNYINSSWAVSKVAGFAIALAIIEGFNGWIDMLEETRKAYEK